ncbi:hypothetical protein P4907_00380 [Escherichia coli]
MQAANTLIVGSKTTSDGSGINKNRGPAGDGYSTTTFTTGNSQIVIGRATTLQYSNIKIQLQADTAGNGNTGVIYCALGGWAAPFHWKVILSQAPTSIIITSFSKPTCRGLYFTMRMYNLWSYALTSSEDFYIGDTNPYSLNLHSTICAKSLGWYQTLGGLVASIDIDFYNDATFDPNASGSVALLSDTTYHYSLKNQSPGGISLPKLFIRPSIWGMSH